MQKLLCIFLLLFFASPTLADSISDRSAVESRMHTTWDKPGKPLHVLAIATNRQHAIVSWSQGDTAGRAILVKNASHEWQIATCTGAAALQPDTLIGLGVSADEAPKLVDAIITQEKSLSEEQRKKMDHFKMPSGQHH